MARLTVDGLLGDLAREQDKVRELEAEVRAHKSEREQLATLRLIVTEKFAGADLYVKPEDAADVAKWAANPGAVRELISHEPLTHPDEFGDEDAACPRCDTQTAAHGRESHPSGGPNRRYCRIAAAWRALGDPRGAADIERAHEEALREQMHRSWRQLALTEPQRQQLVHAVGSNMNHLTLEQVGIAAEQIQRGDTITFTLNGPRDQPVFRLASESEQVARIARGVGMGPFPRVDLSAARRPGGGWDFAASRATSDARGMEAVEEEARAMDLQMAFARAASHFA